MKKYCFIVFLILVSACRDEVPDPVIPPEIVVRNFNLDLSDTELVTDLDIDSNGIADYRLTLLPQGGTYQQKFILRLEGVIAGRYTTNIHGSIQLLSEEQKCNTFYPSVIESEVAGTGDTIGSFINENWWLLSDVHHEFTCLSPECTCSDPLADIMFAPIPKGSTGYVPIRFIIRARRHYGWMEFERKNTSVPAYVLKRIAYNRFPETTIKIGQE